jgi:hypothetical protein
LPSLSPRCFIVHHLTVERQYEGRLLKTEHAEGEQTRRVPVHPALEKLLTWWKVEGFELVFCKKPTPDDPIIPSRDGTHHTKYTAYKAWRLACDKSGVPNRTLHSSRHTFITMCRRGGARKDVLEKVTHNAQGDVVDAYTHWDWTPLCEAVLCLQIRDANRDASLQVHDITVEAPGIEGLWREVGFGGSRGVSFAKSGKTRPFRDDAKSARVVSYGLAGSDCSNGVSLVSKAIVALDAGDAKPAREVLALLLEVMSGKRGKTERSPPQP